jgi:hypothetical protein
MGSTASKQGAVHGWQPATPGATPPKLSKSGYDITPMTLEERNKAAAQLTDFQRSVHVMENLQRKTNNT